MDIKQIWLTTSKNSQLHQVYKILISRDYRQEMIDILHLKEHFSSFTKRKFNIDKRSRKSLIDGDEYYISNSSEEVKNANLVPFFDIIVDSIENLEDSQVLTFRKKKQDYDEKERERFYIILVEKNKSKYLLFVYINSRDIVRKRRFIDPGFSLNKNSTIIDVNHGIPIPDDITATYSLSSQKLYVHNVFQFERMLHLHEAYKEMANKQINMFVQGQNYVGKESYTVKGLDNPEVKEIIFNRVRHTKRIAEFNKEQSNYPIQNIKEAVEMLPNKKDHVKFCNENKKIKVNKKNVGTFVAIVHDSIVRRMISGEVEVI